MATCHSHYVHRNVARTSLAGPALLGGLEEPLFTVKTNKDRYTMLLDDLEREDATSKLLIILLGHTHLAIGSGTALFQLRYKEHDHLLPDTWINQL